MSERFDRFTARAKKVLVLSQEEAQRFNHNYIGTEHLLLGLIRVEQGIAASVLASLGCDVGKARGAVEFIIGRGDRMVIGDISLTPRAKKVLELAVDEANQLKHAHVGTEHVLLGLVREGEGIAAGVLESLGANLDKVRAEVVSALARSGPEPSTADAGPEAEPVPALRPAFPALGNLSRAEVAVAIEVNDAGFLLSVGRAGGCEERQDRKLRWVIGGAPVEYHNAVFHTDLAPHEVDPAIDGVLAQLRAHRVPGSWHVGPTARPADLGRRLLARGFTGGWSDVGMAADLETLPEAGPVPAGLRIERVSDEKGMDAWVRARALDPEGERESRWVARAYAKIGLGDDSPWRHYVGWLDDWPVASASLFLNGATAGLYFVLTVPEVRRQGIGAAITQTALREARTLGYRIGVLGASEMGLGIYRQLGFEEYCRIFVYEWHHPPA